MSRRLPVAVLLALSVAGAAVPAEASAARRVTVTADEWLLSPAPARIGAGSTVLTLRNVGQDSHNLNLRRVGSGGKLTGRTVRIDTIGPGTSRSRKATLTRGTWLMWCAIPNHKPLGMRNTLRVR